MRQCDTTRERHRDGRGLLYEYTRVLLVADWEQGMLQGARFSEAGAFAPRAPAPPPVAHTLHKVASGVTIHIACRRADKLLYHIVCESAGRMDVSHLSSIPVGVEVAHEQRHTEHFRCYTWRA